MITKKEGKFRKPSMISPQKNAKHHTTLLVFSIATKIEDGAFYYVTGLFFHLPKEVLSKSSQRFSYTPFFASMFSSGSGGIYIDIYTTAFPLSFLFRHHRGHDLMFSLNLITSCKRPLRDNHSGNFRHL